MRWLESLLLDETELDLRDRIRRFRPHKRKGLAWNLESGEAVTGFGFYLGCYVLAMFIWNLSFPAHNHCLQILNLSLNTLTFFMMLASTWYGIRFRKHIYQRLLKSESVMRVYDPDFDYAAFMHVTEVIIQPPPSLSAPQDS